MYFSTVFLSTERFLANSVKETSLPTCRDKSFNNLITMSDFLTPSKDRISLSKYPVIARRNRNTLDLV